MESPPIPRRSITPYIPGNEGSSTSHVSSPSQSRISPIYSGEALQTDESLFNASQNFGIGPENVVEIARRIRRLAWGNFLDRSEGTITAQALNLETQIIAKKIWDLSELESLDDEQCGLRNALKKALRKAIKNAMATLSIKGIIDIACALDDLKYSQQKEDDLQHQEIKIFKMLSEKVVEKSQDFQQQDMIWTAYAFRKVETVRDTILNIFNRKNFRVSNFSPYEIGLVARAFTQSKREDVDFFARLARITENKCNNFEAIDIANTIWAYAYMKWGERNYRTAQGFNRSIVRSLKQATLNKINDFKVDDLVRVAWSFVKLRYDDRVGLPIKDERSSQNRFVKRSDHDSRSRNFDRGWRQSQDKAEKGSEDERNTNEPVTGELYKALLEKLCKEIDHLSPPEIANATKSFSSLPYIQHTDLIPLFVQVQKNLDRFSAAEVVKMAGGLLIPYCSIITIEPLIENLLNRIIELDSDIQKGILPPWEDAELSEINTVYKFYNLKSGKLLELPDILKEEIEKYLNKQGQPESSELHLSIASLVKEMYPGFINEYLFGSYFLDMANPDKKIAIEIDGPEHFTINTGEYMGKNQVKNEMLRLSGWELIRIPYQEWGKLSNKREKMDYIKRKLPMSNDSSDSNIWRPSRYRNLDRK